MTEQEFVETYSGANLSEEDIAYLACIKLEWGSNLAYLASIYLGAGKEFLDALDGLDFVIG
jgi:hypothetical protein